MLRLEGASAVVRSAVRPWGVDPAAVVTAFGGATALLFVLSAWYWLGDRRKLATVTSYAFVALGLVLLLKTAFGLPRPPETLWAIADAGDPYGFPSGHAIAAVIVYGGLATVYDRTEPPVLAGTAAVVLLIALSRVVLGVHYLGDVLAGLAIGVVLLVALARTVGQRPLLGFGLAAAVATAAVAVGAPEAYFALGGALGGILGSLGLDRVPAPRSRLERGALVVAGVPLLVGLDAVVGALTRIPLVVLGNAVLVVAVFFLPVVVGWVPLGRAASPAQ
jgi:membrane-associated phospholipid phosphatase